MEKNMSKPGLEPGIKGEKEMVVGDKHLASALGSGLVDVFATAMMIAGMEEVCVASVQPYLEPGTTTVGVGVDVSHCAATPAGMKVHFESELSEISQNGKGLLFRFDGAYYPSASLSAWVTCLDFLSLLHAAQLDIKIAASARKLFKSPFGVSNNIHPTSDDILSEVDLFL